MMPRPRLLVSTHGPLAAGLLVLSIAVAAAADRPSLIDLQAAVDGIISPAPPAVAGSLIVDPGGSNQIALALVDVVVAINNPFSCGASSCSPVGQSQAATVQATVVESATISELVGLVQSGVQQDVRIDIPSQTGVLFFDNAILHSVTSGTSPGRAKLELTYALVSFSRLGTSSSWNVITDAVSGCAIPGGAKHLMLSGNAPSNLGPGEIESTHHIDFVRQGTPPELLTFSRTPPNACHLRGAAVPQLFQVFFDRLWTASDQFGSRRISESIELVSAFVKSWTLRIASGSLSEEVELLPASGTLQLRDFDPQNGDELDVQSISF